MPTPAPSCPVVDGLAHFEAASSREFDVGHLRSRWTFLGEAAGSVGIGVRRMEIVPGAFSTPVHDHGREEEIFYVLGGSGISLHGSRAAPVWAGDCIVYLPRRGGHTVQAGPEGIDLLAFGPRHHDEGVAFARLGASLLNGRALDSAPGAIDRLPFQFAREAELGPPDLPAPADERPRSVVALDAVAAERTERPRVARVRRRLSAAAGSRTTGLQHVVVDPGHESTAQHCHSLEEELFVVLAGDGVLRLDSAEHPVQAGTVVSRPPGTGVAHVFAAGPGGLTYLAYGTREPNDICWYPRSRKIAFRGVGVMARLDTVEDYWDGED